MPKPNRHVPKYRKHKPSGQAVVTLSGVDFYLGPYNSKTSIAEYDRQIAEWLANGRRLPRDEVANRSRSFCPCRRRGSAKGDGIHEAARLE